MRIAEICIKRPVLATVLNLVIVLLGIMFYQRLTVREYPNIDVPVVTVQTKYPGANAEIMESQVTKTLEDSLSGIEGIDFIRSISRAEDSQITVQFKLDRDSDAAASDVRDRVGRVRSFLPEEIDEPTIAKVEADAQPIIWLAFSSDKHSSLDVTDVADRIVKDRLQTLPGVADVLLFAQRRYAMRIWIDRMRLAAYQLTVQDVEEALRKQNVEIPSGRIESVEREFTVLTETDLQKPQEFGKIILKDAKGYLVRLSDVAKVEIGAEDIRQIARFNGVNSIALGVIKQSTANPLQVSAAVRKLLPELTKSIPQGMNVNIAYDSSVFINASIEAVYHTIFEAVVLVMLVIFFFLRSFRATLVPLVTIPISLVGAFIFMYALGFSVNTLTLLSMVLAIGLVVDDAIVVLENIYRHIEEGMKPVKAAIQGMQEIAFAVLAMTVTLAAVFAPIAFTPGRTGKLFIEFALTLAGAVLVSGFVALTLTPMMCSRILRKQDKEPGQLSQRVEAFLDRLNERYRRALNAVLNIRGTMVTGAVIVATLTGFLITLIPSELSPAEDRGVVFGVVLAPEGSTIAYTDKYARQVEGIFKSTPEFAWNFTAVGFPIVSQAFLPLGLKPWDERSRSSRDIIADIGPKMFGGLPGVLAFVINPPSLGQSPRSLPVEFVIQTTGTYPQLEKLVGKIMKKVQGNPGILNMDSDLKLNKPELRVKVNREKAALVGVEIETIGRTLETLLGSRKVNRFKRDGEQYEVMVQIADDRRMTPQDLTAIYVRGKDGQMVQLSNLVTLQEGVAPRELNHFNKLRAATLTANLAPGYSLGEALTFLEDVARKASSEIQLDYGGVSREFKESSSSLLIMFVLALGFIYLVLAAQFESFVDPLIIMFSVPLAMAGALTALKLTGGTLNVYSQIGLVTLVGLITKHGILIVEFANQLQEQGRSIRDAVVEAAVIRLRPILMTTGAMVLGALPLALATGAGAESRHQIGWVIVGGMTLGTFLTLFVVPTFYTLMASRAKREEE